MKRNNQNNDNTTKANHEKLKCNEYYVQRVLGTLKEIKEDMRQFTFHMRMDSVDISDYFPLHSEEDLTRFMDKGHEEWPLRRRAFYHLLYTTVTRSKKKFAGGLLHAIFSRNFIHENKWPYPGYFFVN